MSGTRAKTLGKGMGRQEKPFVQRESNPPRQRDTLDMGVGVVGVVGVSQSLASSQKLAAPRGPQWAPLPNEQHSLDWLCFGPMSKKKATPRGSINRWKMGGRGGVFNRLVYGGGNGPLRDRDVGFFIFSAARSTAPRLAY